MVENSLCEYCCHFSTLVISLAYLINPPAVEPSLSTYTPPSTMSFSRVCMRIPQECRVVCLSVPACMHALKSLPSVCNPPPPTPTLRGIPPHEACEPDNNTQSFNCSTQQSRPMNYTRTMRRVHVLALLCGTARIHARTHTHSHIHRSTQT